jgi:hypothetical protein
MRARAGVRAGLKVRSSAAGVSRRRDVTQAEQKIRLACFKLVCAGPTVTLLLSGFYHDVAENL